MIYFLIIYIYLLNDNIDPKIIPIIIIIIMMILLCGFNRKICSEFRIHDDHTPRTIVIGLIIRMGIYDSKLVWLIWLGFDFIKYLYDSSDIRIEYDAVIPIEIIIIIVRVDFNFVEISLSIIASFEKKPDKKGIPINLSLVIPKIDIVKGLEFKFIPIIRISWYEDSWIIIPAHKNIVDLNIAWIIKCIKAKIIDPNEIENIIIAICLKVDNAIIFFKSCSQFADILE